MPEPSEGEGLVREDIPEEVTSGGSENVDRQSRRQGPSRKGGLPQAEVQRQERRGGRQVLPRV